MEELYLDETGRMDWGSYYSDREKNEEMERERGFGFEQEVVAIEVIEEYDDVWGFQK